MVRVDDRLAHRALAARGPAFRGTVGLVFVCCWLRASERRWHCGGWRRFVGARALARDALPLANPLRCRARVMISTTLRATHAPATPMRNGAERPRTRKRPVPSASDEYPDSPRVTPPLAERSLPGDNIPHSRCCYCCCCVLGWTCAGSDGTAVSEAVVKTAATTTAASRSVGRSAPLRIARKSARTSSSVAVAGRACNHGRSRAPRVCFVESKRIGED